MTTLRRVFSIIVAVGAASLLCIALAEAQDSATAAPAVEQAAETPAADAQPAKLRGRLPAGYGDICDDQQRQAIYAIQAEYAQAIEELEAKLATIRAERDAKIEAVLTPEQLAKVKAAREASRQKRRTPAATTSAAPASRTAPAATSAPRPVAPATAPRPASTSTAAPAK